MSVRQKRTCLTVVGALCLLVLCACGAWAFVFYMIWNLPSVKNGGQTKTVPQPTVAISAENMGQAQLLHTFSQRARINSLAWSPDSRLLAVGGEGEQDKGEPIKLWNVTADAEWHSLERPVTANPLQPLDEAQQFEKIGTVNGMMFSPDGQWLAATYDYGIKVWNVPDGKKLRTINIWHTNMRQVVFSPDGGSIFAMVREYYYSGDVTQECTGIESWDVLSMRPLRCYDGYIGFYLAPEGKILVWKNSQLFDLETGRAVGTLQGNQRALSHNGKVLAYDSGPIAAEFAQSTLTLTDVTNGKVIGKWDKFVWNAPVAFSPDDTVIAAEKEREGWAIFSLSNFIVVLWDPQSGKMRELDIGASSPTSIAFSPDGRFLAIGTDDGDVQVWGVKP